MLYGPGPAPDMVLMLHEDWYNMSDTSPIRSWNPYMPVPHPWKRGEYSPLRMIPGGESWRMIRIDPAHTYAIQGYGSTMATSSCVLLCHLQLAAGRSLNARLNDVYMLFKQWCQCNGKYPSLTGLSMKKLKMKSIFDLIRLFCSYIVNL